MSLFPNLFNASFDESLLFPEGVEVKDYSMVLPGLSFDNIRGTARRA